MLKSLLDRTLQASPAVAAARSGKSLLQIGNPIENLRSLEPDAQALEPPPLQAPPSPFPSFLLPPPSSLLLRAPQPSLERSGAVTKSSQALAHAQWEGLGVSESGFHVSRF